MITAPTMAAARIPMFTQSSLEKSLCSDITIRHGQVTLTIIVDSPLLCSSVITLLLPRAYPGIIIRNSLINDVIICVVAIKHSLKYQFVNKPTITLYMDLTKKQGGAILFYFNL